MVGMSPLFAQKIEMKFGSVKEKVSEVLFRDSNDSIIGRIDIAKMNPFNQLTNKVIEVDELGNKEYIVSQEEFLQLFPEQLRAKYNQYIDYYSISNAKIYSIAQAFKGLIIGTSAEDTLINKGFFNHLLARLDFDSSNVSLSNTSFNNN